MSKDAAGRSRRFPHDRSRGIERLEDARGVGLNGDRRSCRPGVQRGRARCTAGGRPFYERERRDWPVTGTRRSHGRGCGGVGGRDVSDGRVATGSQGLPLPTLPFLRPPSMAPAHLSLRTLPLKTTPRVTRHGRIYICGLIGLPGIGSSSIGGTLESVGIDARSRTVLPRGSGFLGPFYSWVVRQVRQPKFVGNLPVLVVSGGFAVKSRDDFFYYCNFEGK